ncbi:UDP-N-acetyl glucosamine 2-epimerase [endosymbiont 'TC1' of Trimyema compressum]|uniref:non-hydrolyzing UDP-N-acetylglucosamine 2-epimerase n=1 Tax=endosymbiont 'TC1' of Trimyema compressum TaxID=243899 RepID=UPI0007F0BFE2|nr:UDP-N-acetylglucosamine 2-epimerase (non-hydrolyzing) [endosymbiont 'TC1' of Trimyema compressum]AMP19792.1 UDP-N-acetyl glucosamine 2-epimerase [endosymbiont 'TC1' of Trimyema compressum]
MKVISVFGTRPEAIKMAPLVKALEKEPSINSKVIVTAQHRDMLDQVLGLFDIVPDYDLDIMKSGQTLTDVTTRILEGLSPILKEEKPDVVLVHGDTSTTFASALAAFYEKIAVGHVEAGLRTGNKYSPYPEEMNRQLTTKLTDYHFAPTEKAKNNLLAEGIDPKTIYVTGNTVIDALLSVAKKPFDVQTIPGLENIDFNKKIILVTAHRRENLGVHMENIFSAIKDILNEEKGVEVIFPIHKNPKVREIAYSFLGDNKQVHFIEPLDYQPFVKVMEKANLILTDSGGIQEEAPSLAKPVLVLRDTTERPEAVEAGTVVLAGVNKEDIYNEAMLLLRDKEVYNKMANATNPYGDGKTSERIASILSRGGND